MIVRTTTEAEQSPEGSKAVKVGTTIAVLAEPGDDINSLEMPAPESAPSKQEEPKDTSQASKEDAKGPKQADTPAAPKDGSSKLAPSPGKGPSESQRQKYPFYPSVSQLLHERGLGESEAEQIPTTGPYGRLLKGDVLAHLGAIDSAYPGKQADRISKLEHLDLSNIKVAPPPEPKTEDQPSARAEPAAVEESSDVEIAIPISFEAAIAVQKRIRKTLGVEVPLETFIARAINLANSGLPASRAPPTADELFDDVVGIGSGRPKSTRGTFLPDISSAVVEAEPPIAFSPSEDVYDILTGIAPPQAAAPAPASGAISAEIASNVFSVTAPKGDEKRARIFLERMKTALQVEPGSLIM